MRVAIIAPFHDFGGSEHQTLLLLKGLQREGVEFVFFHFDIRSPELLTELESIPGCRHIEIRFRSVKNPFLFFHDSLHLACLLRFYKCELTHCWNYSGHIIGGVASKLARIPCLFSIGGLDPWKKTWQLPFYRLLNRLADGFIFQSVAERDIVSQKEWIPLIRTQVIPNGIDNKRFCIANRDKIRNEIRKKVGMDNSTPLVLSVGSLRPIKGHDVLIEAVRRIREVQSNLQFHVLIVGDGPLREAYEQSAYALPISFAGFRKDVARFYIAADLYCQPSRSEGLPNAVIEAMCCGLPIVASTVGGMAELVTIDNGLLCEPEDPEALSRRLYTLLTHPERWSSMATASIRLSERFAVGTMVDSYVSIYRRLLSGNCT